MECLTSRDNPIIKQYRKLSQSRREREKSGLFVMEGARLCGDAAACGIGIDTLLISEEAERYPQALALLRSCAGRVYSISDRLTQAISDTDHPQGIFAIGKIPVQTETLPTAGKLILLDSIQDPGNLGTIIRTAESMGIRALILSANCPDLYSPKVIRATMGSGFRQKISRVQSLAEAIDMLQANNIDCYAATLTPDALPLQKLRQRASCAIVIGNEGNGVSTQVLERCCGRVYIPMTGGAESLNAAVAAALCMWELSGKYNIG